MSDVINIHDIIGTQARSSSRRDHPATAALHIERGETGEGGDMQGWGKGRRGYVATSFNTRRLPAGLYRFVPTDSGIMLDPQPTASDATIMLPGSPVLEVLAEIKNFRSKAEAFAKRGLLHKRGVLLWGPPGSGKTCAIQLLIQMVVQDGGVACMVESPDIAIDGLKSLRKVEPNREIVAVMEDFDSLIERHGETSFLALLDGEVQVNDIIFVATTNYPEHIDARFLDRPSRFDCIKFVGMPEPESRRHYLQKKEPDLDPETIEGMVVATEGMSIAHLKELVVLTQCLELPMAAAVDRLKRYRARKPKSDDLKGKFGFDA